MFSPWEARIWQCLLHFLALHVLHMLNSPLRQTAEPVCMCVSWALTLFFSLSWHQLPWGSSSHGSTREALELGPTHCIYCICLSLSQLGASVAWIHTVGLLLTCPCVLYLYPFLGGIPTVNFWHLIHAADFFFLKQQKNKVNPKHSCKHVCVYVCVCTESNSIPQTRNFLPQSHWSSAGNTFVSLLSPLCWLTSSRWPLSDRKTDAVKLMKRLLVQRHKGS